MLKEQVEHGVDQEHKQATPLSMLIQLERASELINSINAHGLFLTEMKEWNAYIHKAHMLVHPA